MKRVLRILLFLVGWVLSPFTWWNDAFVNIPLSYLLANILYYVIDIPFRWLVIGLYWFTNALGLFFMYFSGKQFIISSRNRLKAAAFLVVSIFIYSAIMLYLDQKGKLVPLSIFFDRYCVNR